ncbi:MAG: glycolate oxidase subunit GlcE [Acidiferrobacter sp.]
MRDADDTERLCAAIRSAYVNETPLEIRGGGTGRNFGRLPYGEPLSVASHVGILSYDPAEYVVTVRAGTPIAALESLLAAHDQVCVADIPRRTALSTIGGALALGLTGPGRPYSGSLRDAVLGMQIITGTGQPLVFGGQVLKNVAGFDVSRLMVGAYGTLGLITDVTLRLARRPEHEQVCALCCDWPTARARLVAWGCEIPLTGAVYHAGELFVRLSGPRTLVEAAARQIGGEDRAVEIFTTLRDWRHDFFANAQPLWRWLVPASTPLTEGAMLVDWGGAQRFWFTDQPPAVVRAAAQAVAGTAVRLWGGDRTDSVWALPPAPTMALLARIKTALDPRGVLNRGRLYAAW